MKMTINNAWELQDRFKDLDRDYFSLDGYAALLDYYDEINENMECDPIAICCDWNEYGETPCLTWKDFLSDYKYILDDIDGAEDMTEEEKINVLIEELESKTLVIRLFNSILILTY